MWIPIRRCQLCGACPATFPYVIDDKYTFHFCEECVTIHEMGCHARMGELLYYHFEKEKERQRLERIQMKNDALKVGLIVVFLIIVAVVMICAIQSGAMKNIDFDAVGTVLDGIGDMDIDVD